MDKIKVLLEAIPDEKLKTELLEKYLNEKRQDYREHYNTYKEYIAQWRKQHKKEKPELFKQYNKNYYERHKEQIANKKKQFYDENRATILAKKKLDYEAKKAFRGKTVIKPEEQLFAFLE